MGRHAIRYQMTGYLIQAPGLGPNEPAGSTYYGLDRDYGVARDRLEAALMSPGPGVLRDPYNPQFFTTLAGYTGATPTFMCERYSIVEQREKGGFCQIEMAFVEAGLPGNVGQPAPTTQVTNAADQTTSNTATATDAQQQQLQAPTAPSIAPVQIPDTPVPFGVSV